jgi:hypothetical protein
MLVARASVGVRLSRQGRLVVLTAIAKAGRKAATATAEKIRMAFIRMRSESHGKLEKSFRSGYKIENVEIML